MAGWGRRARISPGDDYTADNDDDDDDDTAVPGGGGGEALMLQMLQIDDHQLAAYGSDHSIEDVEDLNLDLGGKLRASVQNRCSSPSSIPPDSGNVYDKQHHHQFNHQQYHQFNHQQYHQFNHQQYHQFNHQQQSHHHPYRHHDNNHHQPQQLLQHSRKDYHSHISHLLDQHEERKLPLTASTAAAAAKSPKTPSWNPFTWDLGLMEMFLSESSQLLTDSEDDQDNADGNDAYNSYNQIRSIYNDDNNDLHDDDGNYFKVPPPGRDNKGKLVYLPRTTSLATTIHINEQDEKSGDRYPPVGLSVKVWPSNRSVIDINRSMQSLSIHQNNNNSTGLDWNMDGGRSLSSNNNIGVNMDGGRSLSAKSNSISTTDTVKRPCYSEQTHYSRFDQHDHDGDINADLDDIRFVRIGDAHVSRMLQQSPQFAFNRQRQAPSSRPFMPGSQNYDQDHVISDIERTHKNQLTTDHHSYEQRHVSNMDNRRSKSPVVSSRHSYGQHHVSHSKNQIPLIPDQHYNYEQQHVTNNSNHTSKPPLITGSHNNEQHHVSHNNTRATSNHPFITGRAHKTPLEHADHRGSFGRQRIPATVDPPYTPYSDAEYSKHSHSSPHPHLTDESSAPSSARSSLASAPSLLKDNPDAVLDMSTYFVDTYPDAYNSTTNKTSVPSVPLVPTRKILHARNSAGTLSSNKTTSPVGYTLLTPPTTLVPPSPPSTRTPAPAAVPTTIHPTLAAASGPEQESPVSVPHLLQKRPSTKSLAILPKRTKTPPPPPLLDPWVHFKIFLYFFHIDFLVITNPHSLKLYYKAPRFFGRRHSIYRKRW
jgi:hypothetical protein